MLCHHGLDCQFNPLHQTESTIFRLRCQAVKPTNKFYYLINSILGLEIDNAVTNESAVYILLGERTCPFSAMPWLHVKQ